ncbi:MAG: sugar phosphate isomerase/epimerase [Candidatus Omnitrophica bacterium]|nr:sugar phosphate isomerase/epimerase [Candidatus Omnitrophota bacterium]
MKLSLFSVSYAGLWGQDRLGLEDFVRHAKKLGYQGIEIMCKRPHLYPFEFDAKALKALKKTIKECGLEMACAAAYTNFTAGSESTEVPLADLQVSYVKKVAELADGLDCRLVRVFTGYEHANAAFKDQWKMCVTGIQACCDAARKYGVTIGIQNHHDIAVDTKALLELFHDIDRENLGLMVDAWSLHLRGENIKEAVQLVSDKMVFSTVADYVILPRFNYHPALVNYTAKAPALVKAVPMGEGVVDYKQYFDALKKVGYQGWVSYETCSPLRHGGAIKNIDEYARQFIKYMRQRGYA